MPAFRFIPILALLAACHSQNDPKQLQTINDGLTQSLNSIQNTTDLAYATLLQREFDRHTRYDAGNFIPAANQSRKNTEHIISYIDSLEASLQQSRSLSTVDAKMLFDSLVGYKNSLIHTFPDSLEEKYPWLKDFRQEFPRHFPVLHSLTDSVFDESHFNAWTDSTFGQNPLITILALNKLKIDIALSEQMVAQYCEVNTQSTVLTFDVFEPLVSINSSTVQPGETIAVEAGIGAYSSGANPAVTISGHLAPLNDHAYALYSFKAPMKPGRYMIPVNFEFTKPDGSRALYDKIVVYTVH